MNGFVDLKHFSSLNNSFHQRKIKMNVFNDIPSGYWLDVASITDKSSLQKNNVYSPLLIILMASVIIQD